MKDYEIFSKRLKKALCHNNRMTQNELSELTKISEVSISRYANGDRIPKGTEIAIIARVLNVSTDYLLGLDDDMNGKEKGTIYVDEILKYCKEAADGWADFSRKALDNIGHGDSHSSSFGAVSFGMERENVYRYEIPNIIRILSEKEDKQC